MGKRKTALKKQNPQRHQAFMKLREERDECMRTIITNSGKEITLNPLKHFLLGKPYKNQEFANETLRIAGRYAQSLQKNKKEEES